MIPEPYYLALELPERYRAPDAQPWMYREWFRGPEIRRYIEYFRRPWAVIERVGLARGARVLDVGCSWGYAAMLANAFGCEAHGVDIDEDSLEFGRALAAENGYAVDLRYARCSQLPYPDAHFDRIVSIEAFEHFLPRERLAALEEMRRCLAPGGRVAISTPNALGAAEVAKRVLGRSALARRLIPLLADPDDPMYSEGFQVGRRPEDVMVNVTPRRGEIAELASRAGLRLVRHDTVVLLPEVLPDALVGPGRRLERLLEPRFPFRHLGTTSVYLLEG